MKLQYLFITLLYLSGITYLNAQAPPPVRDTVLHIGICGGIDTTWTVPYFEEGVQYRWEPLDVPPLQDFVGHEVGFFAENLTQEIQSYIYYMNRTYVDEEGNFTEAFTDTLFFDVYPQPNAFVDISNFSICPGDTGQLYYDALSVGTYLITNPQESTSLDTSNSPLLNLFPTEQTFYELFFTNPGGCLRGPFEVQVNVGAPPPLLDIDLPPVVCNNVEGLKLRNYVNPTTGSFLGNGVLGDTAFFPALAGNGVHEIEYIINFQNCAFSIFDTITVIEPGNISMTPLPNFCLTDPRYELLVGNPAGGEYSGTGVSNGFFTPIDAGIGSHVITYKIEFDEFCSSEVSQLVSVIPIPAKPTFTANPEGITSICDNEVVTLTASEATAYLWQPTLETTRSTLVSIPGKYFVQVTNAAGCSNKSDTLEFLIGETPEIVLLEAAIYPNGFNTSSYSSEDGLINLEVNGGLLPYSFEWSNGSTEEDLANLAAGSYSVVVSDFTGCSTTGEIVLVRPDTTFTPPFPGEGKPFGLPNAFTPNGDGFNDFYVISGLNGELLNNTFRVWDISRRLVFEATNYDNTWDGRDLNGNKLPADTYFAVFDSKTLERQERTFINLRYE